MTHSQLLDSFWRRAIPKYEKGDTTAASARIKEIRRAESLRVPRELIDPPETVEARWRSLHPDEHVAAYDVLPFHPAAPAKRPKERDSAPLTGGCRFPLGDAPPFKFCNQPRKFGKPYCECHTSLTTWKAR